MPPPLESRAVEIDGRLLIAEATLNN